jgi:hypothetical protein
LAVTVGARWMIDGMVLVLTAVNAPWRITRIVMRLIPMGHRRSRAGSALNCASVFSPRRLDQDAVNFP